MSSIGDTIQEIASALFGGEVEVVATAIAAWDTARQTIRTIANAVSSASVQTTVNETLAHFQDVPLSPALLADMSIRGLTIPTGPGTLDPGLVAEAAYSGISPERFAAMSLDTGEPYGIIDALRLLHQGQYLYAPTPNPDYTVGQPYYLQGAPLADTYGIGMPEFTTVVHYSRVRDQFIPDLLQLGWSTMSGVDAINSVVKGRIDMDFGKQLFMAAGGMPEQFELLVEAAGDAVGVEHAVTLWRHGVITDVQLQEVILQSRINPRFYDIATLADRKWLSPFQIHQALVAGTVDAATATQWIIEDGYTADQAAAFATAGASTKSAKPKAETEAMILADFEAQIITVDEATTALTNIGYTAEAVPFILDSVVARRVLTLRNAGINRVRTAFVNFIMNEQTARTALGQLGLPTAAVDQAIITWTIEQQTNVKRLSAAQVGKLVEEAVITSDNAVVRWTQMGYLPEEANLLLAIYPPGSKAVAGATATPTPLPPSGATTV